MPAFSERYRDWAIVAGASEGVGAAVARTLGERGVGVVLVARSEERLRETAAGVQGPTRTLALDLSAPGAASAMIEATSDLDVGLFVYNAGADPYGSTFLAQPVAKWQEMVTRNCVTLMTATHHYAGRMATRGRGGIVLVSSGAAWAGGSHLAVYGATKAFDLILAEALWAELGPQGVDVLCHVLGPTDTPAFRRLLDGLPAASRAALTEHQPLADPQDVAREMLDHLGQGPTLPADAGPFATLTRKDAVELMSLGGSFLAR